MAGERSYDNSGRRAAAAETRRRIVDAAGALFTQHGFAATTVTDVGERAAVSVETVKKRFGTKRDLLVAWFDSAVAGDEGVAVVESRWVERLASVATLGERVRLAAAAVTETHRRSSGARTVAAAAAQADAEIARWWGEERKRRRHDVERIVPLVLGDAVPAMPHDQLVDAIYAISEAHLFHVLCHELGWTDRRYELWLAREVHHLVASPTLDDPPGDAP